MKKILEKIISVSLMVVGLLFIALLLVVMFGAIGVDELDNQVVKALTIALSVIFAVLAVIMIASAFADRDKLNSILLFKDKESATKATVSVVKSLIKKASKRVEAAKVTKAVLIGDENNNVRLIVYIKVRSNDTEVVINRVRAEIMATCEKVLEYNFASVDFKIVGVKADYKPSDSEIDAKIAAYQKEKEAAKKAEAAKTAEETPIVTITEEATVTTSDSAEVIAAVVEAETTGTEEGVTPEGAEVIADVVKAEAAPLQTEETDAEIIVSDTQTEEDIQVLAATENKEDTEEEQKG